jgi:hypothetical protein
MAHRGAESEPVVIDTEIPGIVAIELDDGDRLLIDASGAATGACGTPWARDTD